MTEEELNAKYYQLCEHLEAAADLRLELEKFKKLFYTYNDEELPGWLDECIAHWNYAVVDEERLDLFIDEEEARAQINCFDWEEQKISNGTILQQALDELKK